MMPQADKLPRFQAATGVKAGGSGGKTAKPNNGGALRLIDHWGQSGDKAGAKWGQFYMMKMNSINLSTYPAPCPPPAARPWALLAGFALCRNWAQRVFPWNTTTRCDLIGAGLYGGQSRMTFQRFKVAPMRVQPAPAMHA